MKAIFERGKIASVLLAAAILSASGHVNAENPGGWEYSLAPLYVWAKSIDGKSGMGPTTSELDLDFKDDILENLDTAYSVHFQARQGALTLFAQYNFSRLDPSVDGHLGPVPLLVDVEFEETIWEAGLTYVVVDTGSTQWEVLGGVRGIDQDLDVEIEGQGPAGVAVNVSGGDDWWHGFGGLRVSTALSQNWRFVASTDLGYKSSDNKSVSALGLFDYRFREWGSFFMGYRYLKIDYNNGKSNVDHYSFDGDQQGPLLGFNFYF